MKEQTVLKFPLPDPNPNLTYIKNTHMIHHSIAKQAIISL